MVDLHCHILPGIDDGARDMETAIEMARMAAKDGIRVIVATPHVNPEHGLPTPDAIRERTAALNDTLREEGIDIRVVPGAEHILVGGMVDCLKSGALMTLGDAGKHILVELPFSGYPTFAPTLFFDMQLAGFVPVVAHPERAAVAKTDLDMIRGMAQRGAALQVNADSILGLEGRQVRAIVLTLIREGLADAIASDGHDPKRRPPTLSRVRKALRRLGRS